VLVAGASAIVLIVGIQYFSGIIGPLFLALVLTVAVHPLRQALTRRGLPRWMASVAAILCLFNEDPAMALAPADLEQSPSPEQPRHTNRSDPIDTDPNTWRLITRRSACVATRPR
jgi:hypothetical protein